MFYFDTSFVIPLVLDEPTSARVQRFVAALPKDRLAVSQWTRVEFSSALGRLVRMGVLDSRKAAAADVQFERLTAASFVVLLPAAADYDLAQRYLEYHRSELRAGDALHLAVAANNSAESILTLDRTLMAAGSALGLPVNAGIES
ncbi:MAG TPA: type II toxin-antitoxin system VapC family toxin [Stellaceae bacterium]|nr:type II toxin-antitoxin system VapC family toxin [Stellaceae bacterium]